MKSWINSNIIFTMTFQFAWIWSYKDWLEKQILIFSALFGVNFLILLRNHHVVEFYQLKKGEVVELIYPMINFTS